MRAEIRFSKLRISIDLEAGVPTRVGYCAFSSASNISKCDIVHSCDVSTALLSWYLRRRALLVSRVL